MSGGKLAALALPDGGHYDDGMNTASPDTRPTITWFVSRHAGAIEWAKKHEEFGIDRWVEHLDLAQVRAGDTVIGTLPVNLAAEVCERGALYFHLALRVPQEWRGRELASEDLETLGARIVPYYIQPRTYDYPLDMT